MEDIPKYGMNVLHALVSFLIIISALIPVSHSQPNVVKSLPGYPGNLPFTLETGYIGVGKNEEAQLFYYFVESERDVQGDPLLLWLTGGPGCSGFSGFVYEIGPLIFSYKASNYETSLPILQLNPHSWTKVASIIFVDTPVGTGFSYGLILDACYSDDVLQSQHIYEFLRKGYILGNPLTDDDIYKNKKIPYAHRVSLLSDELYESGKTYCNDDFANIGANNTKCKNSFEKISQVINSINGAHILEPICAFSSPQPVKFLRNKVMLYKQQCRTQHYILSHTWANDRQVQEALHVREGTVANWVRCKSLSTYTMNVRSCINYHQSFTKKFLRALIYSGDQDAIVSYVDSLEWIKQLDLSINNHWRPWFVDGQVAG